MAWTKSHLDTQLINDMVDRYKISLMDAAVFIRRGVTEGRDLQFFLEHDYTYLHQPYWFRDMEMTVERILKSKTDAETVLVYGDSDVDGITSTVILVQSLQSLDIEVLWRVPSGASKYGLSFEDVAYASQNQVTLIITIDCGISNHQEIAYANTLGIDVIVCDHHNPGNTLPEAFSIINAKIQEQAYPFESICAGALAYKLQVALAFSQTDIFTQDICLLNLVPLDGAYNFEIMCVRNLVPQWTRTLTMTPENANHLIHDLHDMVQGMHIIAFDMEMQRRLLMQVLGPNVDFYFTDLKSMFDEYFPNLKDRSLMQIREHAKFARYVDTPLDEIQVLFRLYEVTVMQKYPTLKEALHRSVDLAALATIADMMPLIGENRIILDHGLQKLSKNTSVGMTALMEALKITSDKINVRTIGWQIAPVINASGRMGHADIAVRLLLENDKASATDLAGQLIGFNAARRAQMNAVRKEIGAEAEAVSDKYGKFIVLFNDKVLHTLTGVIAGNLLQKHGVPVIVFALQDENTISASIRCGMFMNATKLVEALRPFLLDGGGHKAAAGFSFERKNQERVTDEIVRLLSSGEYLSADPHSSSDRIPVDIEIPAKHFSPSAIKTLVRTMSPYGEKWDTLNILFTALPVHSCNCIGGKGEHIRYMLRIGEYSIPALIWNFVERQYDFEVLNQAQHISIVASPKVDFYNGIEQLSFIVQDMEIL